MMKFMRHAFGKSKKNQQNKSSESSDHFEMYKKHEPIRLWPSGISYTEFEPDLAHINIEQLLRMRDELTVCSAADSFDQNGLWESFYYNADESLKRETAYNDFYDKEQGLRTGMLMPPGYQLLPKFGSREMEDNDAPEGFIDQKNSGLKAAAFINHKNKNVIIGLSCSADGGKGGNYKSYQESGSKTVSQAEMVTVEVMSAVAHLKGSFETKDYNITIVGHGLGGLVASGIGLETTKRYRDVAIHTYNAPEFKVPHKAASHLALHQHLSHVMEGSSIPVIYADDSVCRVETLLGKGGPGRERIGTEIRIPSIELAVDSENWQVAKRFKEANPMSRHGPHTPGGLFEAATLVCMSEAVAELEVFHEEELAEPTDDLPKFEVVK